MLFQVRELRESPVCCDFERINNVEIMFSGFSGQIHYFCVDRLVVSEKGGGVGKFQSDETGFRRF